LSTTGFNPLQTRPVDKELKFLFLESFFGGSHRAFATGLAAHSRHRIDLLTLPARFWRWRIRGAALYFARAVDDLESYDGVIIGGMFSLADFKALAGGACPPTLAYFHENQLTYPLGPGGHIDHQLGHTDITTALAAERLLFNSRTHRAAFLGSLPGYLARMPEYRPGWIVAELAAKADVLYPGCDFPAEVEPLAAPDPNGPPLVVWNHRWDYDKNPGPLFAALDSALEKGAEFRLALLGESPQPPPGAFVRARERFGGRIVHFGYAASRAEYFGWLKQGAIVVSTARQENFGLAVVEAVRCGCLPLLPARLSYPEIIPDDLHDAVFYRSDAELNAMLLRRLTDYPRQQGLRSRLAAAMGRFAWPQLIGRYDAELERLAARRPGRR
jgi:glycosyltransferase involved in cell wall biosynthesis